METFAFDPRDGRTVKDVGVACDMAPNEQLANMPKVFTFCCRGCAIAERQTPVLGWCSQLLTGSRPVCLDATVANVSICAPVPTMRRAALRAAGGMLSRKP